MRRLFEGLITHNEALEIIRQDGARTVTMSVRCHANDASRLLGKSGAHFKAVKFIAAAAGLKYSHQVRLAQMLPPVVGSSEPNIQYRYKPEWPRQAIQTLLADVCLVVFAKPIAVTLNEKDRMATFVVNHHRTEPERLVSQLAENVQTLFGSIGMMNGCVITVDFATAKEGK